MSMVLLIVVVIAVILGENAVVVAQAGEGGILELNFTCFDVNDLLPAGISLDTGELCAEISLNMCDLELGVYVSYNDDVLVDEFYEDPRDLQVCTELVDDLACEQCVQLSSDEESIFRPDYVKICPVVVTKCTIAGFEIETDGVGLGGCLEFGDECRKFNGTSCETCAKNPGCGWCADSKACKPVAIENDEKPFCDSCAGAQWLVNTLDCARAEELNQDGAGFAGEATTPLVFTFSFVGLLLVAIGIFCIYKKRRKNGGLNNEQVEMNSSDFAPLRLGGGEPSTEDSSNILVSSDIQYELASNTNE